MAIDIKNESSTIVCKTINTNYSYFPCKDHTIIQEKINAININKNAGSVIHNAKILAEVFVTLSLGKENCRTPFW